MNIVKNKLMRRLLAITLAVAMVFTSIPAPYTSVYAITENGKTVVISVADEEGKPLTDAIVIYTIYGEDESVKAEGESDKTSLEGTVSITVPAQSAYITGSVKLDGYTEGVIRKTEITAEDNQEIPVLLQEDVKLIEDVTISGFEGENALIYADGEALDAVKITGDYDDVVYEQFDSEENQWSVLSDKPKVTTVGTYKYKVTVTREGFEPLVREVVTIMKEKEFGEEIEGLDIKVLSPTYDENTAYKLLELVSNEGGYDLAYTKLEKQISETDWEEIQLDNTQVIPMATDAGVYRVTVSVSKDNYVTKEIPYLVTINKANQVVVFNEYEIDEESTFVLNSDERENIYDFSAILSKGTDNVIVYSIENATDDEKDINKIAVIDTTTGELTVKSAGCITVTATVAGDDNYNEVSISHTVVIKDTSGVSFQSETQDYVFGESVSDEKDGVISNLVGEVAKDDDNGTLTYSIVENEQEFGVSVDSITGEIIIKDYEKLGNALLEAEGNTITFTVKVNKGEGTKKLRGGRVEKVVYKAAEATYKVNVNFMDTPAETYTISGDKGTIDETKTNWYVSKVTLAPVDQTLYTISNSFESDSFAINVEFNDQGSETRYVYLRNIETGGITNRIPLNVNIDTVQPDANNMKVEFSELNLIQKLGELLGFYNPTITVKFTAEDVTSGINHFDWTYVREEGVSSSNVETLGGKLGVTVEGNKATANLVLPKDEANQLRGHIAFTATDNAGNVSKEKKNDVIVVVDTVSPTMTMTHELVDETKKYIEVENQHYYSSDVKLTFTVTETNFYIEDVLVSISKDGQEATEIEPEWNKVSDDVHEGIYTLSGDGDYVVTVTYKDKSSNEMVPYQSEVITIDTILPVVDFEFDQENQKTIFTVVEHNFRPQDITVTTTATDINGNEVSVTDITDILRVAEWTQDEENQDLYTYEISEYTNARYDLVINYIDMVGNEATTVEPDEVIIDHGKPTNVTIAYSKSLVETVLEVITLGFYNPSVDVTFTAYDTEAGVESFTWNYIKQEGASDVNRETDNEDKIAQQIVEAVQDETDKSKYTATITLTATEAEQLRGSLAVIATDKYENSSDKVTDDGRVIVVDTISPTMTVEYIEADRVVETTSYYNNDIKVSFTVKEANFFAEDVKVSLTKNGNTTEITPTWTDMNVDTHIGSYTITGDGHYVINVEYTDRSNNKMVSYTSNMITIDTVIPVIDVDYSNSNVINTNYFDAEQIATVTINEHNFYSNEVDFTITAKDVTGKEVTLDSVVKVGEWKSEGDVHTIDIVYNGDANYTFDVEYTDLATNKAIDYKEDEFTVDKTKPTNLSVEFVNPENSEVDETSTDLGYFNPNVEVVFTATDVTAGVDHIDWSYIREPEVSDINTDKLSGTIEVKEEHIDGDTVTITLVLPEDEAEQLRGNIAFTATDKSGNVSDICTEDGVLIVDTIAPTAQIAYNEAFAVENEGTDNQVSYYDGEINATVTITEANFDAEDVNVLITKDGGEPTEIQPEWTDTNTDIHVGTFTLIEDGHYVVTVEYTDKSNNQMTTYTSKQLTIDTQIEAPTITVNGSNGNGRAYKDAVVPAVSFEDENFKDYEIRLTRTRYGARGVDVTSEYISGVTTDAKGGSGSFDTFDMIANNDGIYTLTVKMTDKAGHSSEDTIIFTVNRFGSVYEYNEYLSDLISNGGAYVESITQDLIITEYNADRLVADSLVIEITRDGRPLDEIIYDVSPVINNSVGVGSSGWYQYQYTISQENFTADGVYKISISSEDATGNTPENSNYENMDITFRVDSTIPEISSIVGLEEAIINATEVEVKYTVFDTIGIKSIQVIVNGELVDNITDFSSDMNNYSGSFVISESNDAQTVQIIVTDMAGNVTDTSADDFESAYEFNNTVTVSTNFLVRWYANKPLFFGSLAAIAAGGWSIWYFLIGKKKKEEEEEETE